MNLKKAASILACFAAACSIFSQSSELQQDFSPEQSSESAAPEIHILDSAEFTRLTSIRFVSPKGSEEIKKSNELFRQYQKDLELNSRLKRIPFQHRKESDYPSSLFYIYKVIHDSDNYLNTFNGLAARLQISQGTLATVNSISSPDSVNDRDLILPVNQGLFISKKPVTALEILIQNEYSGFIDEKTTPQFIIDGKAFYFLADRNFSGTDIAFFHDDSMLLPLSKKILTSPFGYRTSPISGKWTFHAGIDLAAPSGTDVFACKAGIVSQTGFNSTYGNYVILLHNGSKTSLYAHLSKILVKKDDRISAGQVIGLVGTTGASTGPHLHFEVRENGNPKDPGKLIN